MLNLITGVIPYVIILSIVVCIHELGHTLAARAFGLRIKEFSIGFGPVLWEAQKVKSTRIVLRAIPLGGFIRVSGNENKDYGTESLNPWKRIVFYMAGPAANLFAAGIIIIVLALQGTIVSNPAVLEDVMIKSGAHEAGLLPGDRVTGANGALITSSVDLITVTSIVPNNTMINLTVERNGQSQNYMVQKRNGKIGVQFKNSPASEFYLKRAEDGLTRFITLTYNMIGFPIAIVQSGQNFIDKMHGPVGIADLTGNVIAQTGSLLSLLLLGVQISIAMGVFNLLPLPILDGGRIAFALYEITVGSKLSPRIENVFNAVSIYLILLLLIKITTKDLSAYF